MYCARFPLLLTVGGGRVDGRVVVVVVVEVAVVGAVVVVVAFARVVGG